MSPPLAAAIAYAGRVFGAGFILGALRTMWLEPAIGSLAAVALELPLMLAISWFICGRMLDRFAVPPTLAARGAMGALALALLLVAEYALARGFGQSSAEYLARLASPAGALGLAGQALFGLMPLIRRSRLPLPGGGP